MSLSRSCRRLDCPSDREPYIETVTYNVIKVTVYEASKATGMEERFLSRWLDKSLSSVGLPVISFDCKGTLTAVVPQLNVDGISQLMAGIIPISDWATRYCLVTVCNGIPMAMVPPRNVHCIGRCFWNTFLLHRLAGFLHCGDCGCSRRGGVTKEGVHGF